MKLYNLKDHSEQVSFAQAVQQGLGRGQGLFFPEQLPKFSAGLGKGQGLFFPEQLPKFSDAEIESLLNMDFVTRSAKILSAFIGNEINDNDMHRLVQNAFQFPAPVKSVEDDIGSLELYHGPTLAFKDFGGRFMAQALVQVAADKKITILTATSGDTGAAVAHAFYHLPNIRVVILYPEGKISPLQEKLFCTLGDNIHTIAIQSDFDACQALVKKAFDDEELKTTIGLNSANSINISRLLAQICYYFEAYAQLTAKQREQLVISVPSGNFGDLTAGLLAKTMGLPIKRFIAATNANDTVPRYLETGKWEPHKTVATLSNAMDVSQPNNWPRIEEIYQREGWVLKSLGHAAVSDEVSVKTVQELDKKGEGEYGLFLGTAHPAKFKEVVEDILGRSISLPSALAERAEMPLLSHYMPDDFTKLRDFLISLTW